MTADAVYILLNRSLAPACDLFDGHVLACVLSIAAEESSADRSLAEALGISGNSLTHVQFRLTLAVPDAPVRRNFSTLGGAIREIPGYLQSIPVGASFPGRRLVLSMRSALQAYKSRCCNNSKHGNSRAGADAVFNARLEACLSG